MKKQTIGILSALAGAVAGAAGAASILDEERQELHNLADKHLALYLAMNQWVNLKQEGKNLYSYFEEEGFHKIAIYGMSYMGETLINELRGSDIEVVYGIDRNSSRIYSEVEIFSMEDTLEEVDAIVVTAITFFDEIEEKLAQKVECPIISLEDILYEV